MKNKKKKGKFFTFDKCDICKKQFTDKYLLEHHVETHNPTRSYQCNLCEYAGTTKKYLNRHVRLTHSEPKRLKCEHCDKMFHFKSKLTTHMRVHTGERPYKCEVCGKTFNSRYSLSTHKFIHTDEKPYRCMYCKYACRDNSTLRKHQSRHTGDETVYQCTICPKSYKAKHYLKMHVAEVHLEVNVRKYICDICGKRFKEKNRISYHITTVHQRLFTLKCEICGHMLTNKNNLTAHLRTHIEVKPYKCVYEGCSKRFKDKTSLNKHTVIHYPEQQHPCDICGKLFSRQSRLNKHIQQHEPKEKKVECGQCGVCFYNDNYLRRHMTKIHGVGSKYECDECGYVAKSKAGVVVHIRHGHAHNDKKCDICKRSFKKQSNLKMHYWKIHNIRHEVEPGTTSNEPDVEVKEEPVDVEENDLMEILDKVEKMDDEDLESIKDEMDTQSFSKEVLPEDLVKAMSENAGKELGSVPNEVFDEFYVKHVTTKKKTKAVKKDHVDKKSMAYADSCFKKLMKKLNRKVEGRVLEKARKQYNRRMKKIVGTLGKEQIKIKYFNNKSVTNGDENEEPHAQNNDTRGETSTGGESQKKSGNVKLKLNIHQCYVCFKLYNTKKELIDHCKIHFDICNEETLTKCPLCDFVTNVSLPRHMRMAHKINITIPYMKMNDKNDNTEGSRYYYNVHNSLVKEIEVIPSVKNLNNQASIKIDKGKRESKDKVVAKAKLVKIGGEWVVDSDRLEIDNCILPKFKIEDIDFVKKLKIAGNGYLVNMQKLGFIARKNGVRMMYPCKHCEKVCQTLNALKLHCRRHDPNPKPYKPKVWKHKNKKPVSKNKKPINTDKTINADNRHAEPKPIVGKHRCDEKLKHFYENNIKGGDVEFWQFLKIYNKMDREKVEDFSDLEKRREFGIHVAEKVPTDNSKVAKLKVRNKIRTKTNYIRVIRTSRKEYERKCAIIKKLREKIANNLVN